LAKGDTWQIPISVANVKSIVIYNTSGQIVYKQSQPFPSNFEWKGTNIQGMELSEGLYKVVVTYQKESCIFNVSILN
jgi:flagellar hook assembly protein FlgD